MIPCSSRGRDSYDLRSAQGNLLVAFFVRSSELLGADLVVNLGNCCLKLLQARGFALGLNFLRLVLLLVFGLKFCRCLETLIQLLLRLRLLAFGLQLLVLLLELLSLEVSLLLLKAT